VIKDFDYWNSLKKNLDSKHRNIKFKEGQIWWCSIGLNIGSEQNGGGKNFERPVIILKKFFSKTLLILPITSKSKFGNYYFSLDSQNTVILCQPRLIDSNRLSREIKNNSLNHRTFTIIKRRFKNLI
jgi:mRNA-degrading endonuclease toxin of MazEF toxin-antitoxin module